MKCAYCGKQFRVTSAGWGYAYGGMYTCSYKCMRAMEREDAGMTDVQKQQVEQLMADGKSYEEISQALGASTKELKGYYGGRIRKVRNEARAQAADEMQAAPAGDDVRLVVVRLIQDMLDVLKRLYGI